MSTETSERAADNSEATVHDRLDSWKEIASYLKREIRTLHRWEHEEGLPVHRHLHKKRGTVYAYKSELEAWWQARRPRLEAEGKLEAPTGDARRRLALRLAIGLSVALVAAGYWGWQRFQPTARVSTGKVVLVVLPFENLSGDPEQEYLSDGLTEELIAHLGGLHPERLGVIARATAMKYKVRGKSAAEIGRELNVGYILDGSVRRAGGTVRITVKVIQVSDQTHVWTKSYERSPGDILGLQEEIVQAVAREIELQLPSRRDLRAERARPVKAEAHEAYLKGLYFWNKFTIDALQKSIEYYNQALQHEPDYAEAYAGLAASYTYLGHFGVLPSKQAYTKCWDSAAKAIELDATVSFAHSQMGFCTMFLEHDWARAEQEFRRAIQLNPSNGNAHEGYAVLLIITKRTDEGLREIRRAREVDPLSLIINGDVGFMLYFARQFDEAIEQLEKTLEMDPDLYPTNWILAQVYAAQGKYDEAHKAHLKTAWSARMSAREPSWGVAVERAYRENGWKGRWQKCLEFYMEKARAEGSPLPAFWMAEAYAHVGDKEKTLEWLEKAADERFYRVTFVGVDPLFDPYRSDPRFQDLVRRMGLPQ